MKFGSSVSLAAWTGPAGVDNNWTLGLEELEAQLKKVSLTFLASVFLRVDPWISLTGLTIQPLHFLFSSILSRADHRMREGGQRRERESCCGKSMPAGKQGDGKKRDRLGCNDDSGGVKSTAAVSDLDDAGDVWVLNWRGTGLALGSGHRRQ